MLTFIVVTIIAFVVLTMIRGSISIGKDVAYIYSGWHRELTGDHIDLEEATQRAMNLYKKNPLLITTFRNIVTEEPYGTSPREFINLGRMLGREHIKFMDNYNPMDHMDLL